jgi:hypothetical protein
MISDREIDAAKQNTRYSQEAHHEHNDCIRMAYEWLDAQKTVKVAQRKYLPLKHIIEKWAGRYVSQSDVEVAATMHPRLQGHYPNYNLSARLTRPNDRRLGGISEALSQGYRDRINETRYAIVEE